MYSPDSFWVNRFGLGCVDYCKTKREDREILIIASHRRGSIRFFSRFSRSGTFDKIKSTVHPENIKSPFDYREIRLISIRNTPRTEVIRNSLGKRVFFFFFHKYLNDAGWKYEINVRRTPHDISAPGNYFFLLIFLNLFDNSNNRACALWIKYIIENRPPIGRVQTDNITGIRHMTLRGFYGLMWYLPANGYRLWVLFFRIPRW